MNKELLEAGKKVRNEIINITGQLEALELFAESIDDLKIAYVSNKISGQMIVSSVLSKDKANQVQKTAIKAIEDEIAVYEDKLAKIIRFNEQNEEAKTEKASKEETKMTVEEIKQMLRDGKSLQAIADYYKVTKKAIYSFLERNNTGVKALRP